MTSKARQALIEAQTIVGYTAYIGLIDDELLQDKEIISTGMTGEVERCHLALKRTMSGNRTVVVCSGDPGIYGMAGLILELMSEQGLMEKFSVQIIPGIPALSGSAAVLGAPLMHDFASISLSDLLTPWEVIEKRVEAAVKAGFVLVLYNPKSKKRTWQLPEVIKRLGNYLRPDTPVGIVRDVARQDQSHVLTTLSGFDADLVDMHCTVIVGNSQTKILNGWMVTPRGYKAKYDLQKSFSD